MLPTNQLLNQGRYRISQPLGQNGVGLLYEAYDNVLQSKVIVKEIAVKLGKVSTVSQQENLKIAFSNEAKTLKEINHEAFLRIHDYFSEIDRHYLVMEANDENTLKELLERKGRAFSYAEISNWADQMLDALNYLHSQMPPVIHRDIKPQNLKLSADGKIRLSSPGISKNLSETINKTDVNQPSTANSLHYLPLEQIWESLDAASQKVITNSYDEKSEEILKQPTDAASDVYSLGATLYYLLTAQLPIDALERSIDILEGKSDPLPSPTKLNPAIPTEVSNVLMKALEIKREKRFSAASVMRQVLRTAVLQIQERKAEEAQAEEAREEAEALQELRLAEQKRIEFDRRMLEQQTLELEAEQKRLEAEHQLVEKKKLAIEAERKRQEELLAQKQSAIEAKNSNTETPTATVKNPISDNDILELETRNAQSSVEKAVHISAPANATKAAAPVYKQEISKQEDNILFADSPKPSSGIWKIPAAVMAVVVLGGAGLGVWYSQQSNAGNSNQSAPVQSLSNTESSKPAAVNQPAPVAETTPNTITDTITDTTATPAENLNQAANPAAVKTKPLVTSTPPKPKKQVTPPPQTADNQKKPVTVDDIINDN